MSDVSLDPSDLLAEARARTGLDDFGDDGFLEPLRRLAASLEADANLHEVGRATQRERIVGLLVNRLRAEATIRRHPEILDETLEAPLVIVGLPRTGTTMLHRMLAADPRHLALLWWESRHPAPFDPDDLDALAPGAADPRIRAAEEEVAAMCEAAPDLVAAHPMDAHAPDEEIMLLEHAFLSANPEAFARIPGFARWLAGQDLAPGYAYLVRLLKLVQWQKRRRGDPGERWVLKTPAHLGHLDLLFDALPDARVVHTHRDPVQTIPSLASLVHLLQGMGTDHVDAVDLGRHWNERFRVATDACLAFRSRPGHDARFLDIDYRELVADPMAQIARIHAFAGIPPDPAAEDAMRAWAVENARDKRPVHRYTLESFGFTEAGLARDFAAYRARFIRSPESVGA